MAIWFSMTWQVCSGTGGNFAPEQVAGFGRNRWQVCSGICSARLTADVVAKTVSMLNDYKAGKFVATFHIDEETETCLECHEEDQEGKMSCTACHDPHF